MNTYELVSQTMRQCQMDPTDAADRAEHEVWIIPACNEAYRAICRDKLHLWKQEAVTLDADKQFALSALSETVSEILQITQYPDYASTNAYARGQQYFWNLYDKNTVVVPAATASAAYYVKYEYIPADLVILSDEPDETFAADETNTPQINTAWHPILTYWAAAQYYLGQKSRNYIQKGNLWMNIYDRAMSEVTDSVGEPQQLKGAYHSWI